MNIRDMVRKQVGSASTKETAALVTVTTRALPTSIVSVLAKSLKTAGKYTVTKKAADKGSWRLNVSAKVRRGVSEADAKSALNDEVNRLFSEAKKQAAKTGKEPKGKSVAKKPAPAKAAAATNKAPKGTGKLKSFMKENGIDLKTLKALVKHITPSK